MIPMTEPSEAFHDAKVVTIPVSLARLASGRYDHGRSRDIGEGDIHASYSADTIASAGKIRKDRQESAGAGRRQEQYQGRLQGIRDHSGHCRRTGT